MMAASSRESPNGVLQEGNVRPWASTQGALAGVERLPTSPALTRAQLLAATCGKKYRAAIKGIFDNLEMVLNEIVDPQSVDAQVQGRSSEELSQRLLVATRKMYGVSLRAGGVDYAALKQSPAFKEYLQEAQALWFVDPSDLPEEARKAFFINVYNALVIHAILAVGRPQTGTDRMHFYSRASYVIGGRIYSLNDIEHGILRGNRMSWQPIPIRPFTEYDARNRCVVPLDPRVHFALNCGAWGCPVVRFYEASTLNQTLDLATKMFLEPIDIDVTENRVVLSSIFSWYQADFASGPLGVLQWILPYLEGENHVKLAYLLHLYQERQIPEVKVVFSPYDWGLNDAGSMRC